MSVEPNRSSPASDKSSSIKPTTVYVTTTRSPWTFALVAGLVITAFFVVQRLLFPTGTVDRDIGWLTRWNVVTAAGETVEAKHRWLREAFSNAESLSAAEQDDARPGQVDAPEPLVDVMNRITRESQSGTERELIDSISWEFYLATLRECEYFDASISSSQVDPWLLNWVMYPWVWYQYRVLHWERTKDRARALVLLVDRDGHFHETRWWFVVRDGRWLIYDWELLDFGIRETTDAALAWTLHDTPEMLAYQDLLSASRDDPTVFEQELPIPEPLHDSLYVQLAYDYLERKQWEVALRMAHRVKQPETTLGGLVVKARAEISLGRLQDATKTLDHLESLIGPSIQIRELRGAIQAESTGTE